MKQITATAIPVFYDPSEQAAAEMIVSACQSSTGMLSSRWNLSAPADCRIYVMTSGLGFLFQAAPWPWKIYLALLLPWYARRVRDTWDYSGGWSLPFGRRMAVGIKPPRLVQSGDRGPGEQFFASNRSLDELVATVTCHELTHAFTFHLHLPPWLHEGLATLAMEYYLDRRIVRTETLLRLAKLPSQDAGRRPDRNYPGNDFIPLYARGYWLARYIDETHPELMRDLLSRRRYPADVNAMLAHAYGKTPDCFWREIDAELTAHFKTPCDSIAGVQKNPS